MQSNKLRVAERFSQLSKENQKIFLKGLEEKGIDFSSLPIIHVAHEDKGFPLSYAQQRQWAFWQLEPDNGAYNIPLVLSLKGNLNFDALQKTFNKLVERHTSLRSTFGLENDQPL